MKWLNPDTMKFYTGPKKAPETMEADGYLPYEGNLPAERLDVVDGEIVELPEPPATEDWRPLSAFVMALRQLVPEAKAVEIMSSPDLLLDTLAGALQLASEKTQGGFIDMMHPEVPMYLAVLGVTVDEVIALMGGE